MRADQHGLAGIRGTPEHVADPVDRCLQPGRFILRLQPAARRHIRIRQGRPHHAVSHGTDGPQISQVCKQAFGIDLRHAVISYLEFKSL